MDGGAQALIRPFARRDVAQVLDLMRALAVFEGYIDRFQVSEADLIEHGLGPSPRFGLFVAELAGHVVGIAVHYIIPWTFDLKPTLVLKELFVAAEARGLGVGRALMTAIVEHAARIGAPRVNWLVLAGNERAKRFYESLGGQHDIMWEPWTMAPNALNDSRLD
ncbi:hypothetical protein CLG96_00685 [Sphingomonas oleivorans]|uniref:N-acetyltransferase domain-containing protein n=1 Tax=Sphingomonas oleivorans TaxID=1735121 RepID=A0A2T5G0Q3_9SPHN|nr:GNAT family N-acetyltransferase [Sphingomonas oleivorans]PTQ12713.1 hypothetical protein CLG96_00685 [Sphingomonas oleivorans]